MIELLSFPISTLSYSQTLERLISIAKEKKSFSTCVANVHMLVEAHKDENFAAIINSSDFVTADGRPLSLAIRLLYGIHQERVAGPDLLVDLMKRAEEEKLTVYFYGGSPTVLQKTETYIQQNYPKLTIAGLYSPPFRELTPVEEKEDVDRINNSGASLVFVVLGCPKQEKWMAKMKGRINALMIGIGGALPVVVGEKKRPAKWLQNLGLEWVFRLAQEPRRLFRRYAVTNSIFLYLLTKEFIKIRILGIKPGLKESFK